MKRLLGFATVLALCWASTAFAHGYKAGAIEIDHPWARATAAAAPTGTAYFVLNNTGKEDDRLVSVSTLVFEKAGSTTVQVEVQGAGDAAPDH